MAELRVETTQPNNVEISSVVAGDGPLVLLLHGFPELSYSWRHQIHALADAGYRVVAPDGRGYGASACPEPIEAYRMVDLVGDAVGLINHYGDGGPALVVGHDWGSWVAWSTALWRPDLLVGVCGVSVPYTPSVEISLLDMIRASVGDDGFHYITYFQDPGVAEAELDADPIDTVRRVLWMASADIETASVGDAERQGFLPSEVPAGLPPWLGQGDLDAYAQAFMRTGFRGGLNWYRNIERNHRAAAPWRYAPITIPAMFVGGRQDPVLTGTGDLDGDHPVLDLQAQFVADLRVELVDNAGHWTQQEQPEAVNALLADFAADVFGRGS